MVSLGAGAGSKFLRNTIHICLGPSPPSPPGSLAAAAGRPWQRQRPRGARAQRLALAPRSCCRRRGTRCRARRRCQSRHLQSQPLFSQQRRRRHRRGRSSPCRGCFWLRRLCCLWLRSVRHRCRCRCCCRAPCCPPRHSAATQPSAHSTSPGLSNGLHRLGGAVAVTLQVAAHKGRVNDVRPGLERYRGEALCL